MGAPALKTRARLSLMIGWIGWLRVLIGLQGMFSFCLFFFVSYLSFRFFLLPLLLRTCGNFPGACYHSQAFLLDLNTFTSSCYALGKQHLPQFVLFLMAAVLEIAVFFLFFSVS
jgi:hypothetical protein